MKSLTIAVFLLVIHSLPVLADSGYYYSDYPGPQPFNPIEEHIEHPDVVMTDEEVSISLGQGGAFVYADFTFRNEGPAQTLPMSFPLEMAVYRDYPEEEEYRKNP